MSVITLTRALVGRGEPEGKLGTWLAKHRTSFLVMLPVLALVAAVSIHNFDGFPGRDNDDEGTYVTQAWAILYRGELAHYTYWYDHPPFGWIQIAIYAWFTDGYNRAVTAVTVGREFMVLMHLISSGLLYMLIRRLGFHRVTGVVTVLLFTLSPLALFYHRMVFLDNIAMTWTLAAMVFAASQRRSLAAALGAAISLAGAALTKETAVIMVIPIFWLLYQHRDKAVWLWSKLLFGAAFVGIGLFYPLYAILKNELLEGPGHVSLVWAIKWQLFEREGTGSVLDTTSVSYQTVHWWLETDAWLLVAGGALVIPAMFVRRLRPLAFAMGLQAALLLRSGYLPQPYVIALIPLAALLVAGMGEVFIRSRVFAPTKTWPNKFFARIGHSLRWGIARFGIVAVLVGAAVFGVAGSPTWAQEVTRAANYDPAFYSKQATNWTLVNVDRDAVIITDDNIWADLVMDGYKNPVWLYKADLDPAIKDTILKNGWQDIDYLVLPDLSEALLKSLPTVWEAIQHSRVVTTYGEGSSKMIIREVIHQE